MSAAFDAVTGFIASFGGTTQSFTHTPVGIPTAVALCVAYNNILGGSFVSATYGGVPMPVAVSNGQCLILGLANPPPGAQTVVLNFDTTTIICVVAAITATGSDTSTCFSATNSNSGSATTASVTVSANPGDLCVDCLNGNNTGGSPAPGAGQTSRFTDSSNPNVNFGASTEPATGSTTMTWSGLNTNPWNYTVAAFKAAPPAIPQPTWAEVVLGG